MSFTIWVVIALFVFILPAVGLTNGGQNQPGQSALERYARTTGLPLTAAVAEPVVARIRRRQRGMLMGGLSGLGLGTALAITTGGADTGGGAAPLVLSFVGLTFGGAWAIASHRPEPTPARPVVARSRTTRLADYLTRGERFGLWVAPAGLVVGAAAGVVLLMWLPPAIRDGQIVVGLVGSGLFLLAWGAAVLSVSRVLAAPARSGSDLELAWDDAERAGALRELSNLAVATSCAMFLLWLVLIGEALTRSGFSREDLGTASAVSVVSLVVFLGLGAVVAGGPMVAWMTGSRRGYELRQLWPNGVVTS